MRQQNNAEKSSSSLLYSYFVQIRDSGDTILRNAIVPLSRTASVRCRCCL